MMLRFMLPSVVAAAGALLLLFAPSVHGDLEGDCAAAARVQFDFFIENSTADDDCVLDGLMSFCNPRSEVASDCLSTDLCRELFDLPSQPETCSTDFCCVGLTIFTDITTGNTIAPMELVQGQCFALCGDAEPGTPAASPPPTTLPSPPPVTDAVSSSDDYEYEVEYEYESPEPEPPVTPAPSPTSTVAFESEPDATDTTSPDATDSTTPVATDTTSPDTSDTTTPDAADTTPSGTQAATPAAPAVVDSASSVAVPGVFAVAIGALASLLA